MCGTGVDFGDQVAFHTDMASIVGKERRLGDLRARGRVVKLAEPGRDNGTMRTYLNNAPWWVLSILTGVMFGGWMTVFGLLEYPERSPVAAAIGGAVSGIFFGAIMGPFTARQRRGLSAAAGDLSTSDTKTAARAATRGPVPLDDTVRHAAARIAVHQLNSLSRLRWVGLITFGLGFALYIFLAVTSSPWWWAASVFFAAAFVGQFWWPRHLQRRIDLLTADADA